MNCVKRGRFLEYYFEEYLVSVCVEDEGVIDDRWCNFSVGMELFENNVQIWSTQTENSTK